MSVEKILRWIMLLSASISACNLFVFYFFPLIFPMANFSIIKITFIAIAEKKYSYILISCMLILLVYVGAISIKQNYIVLSILSFIVFLADLIHVGILFFRDLFNNYVNTIGIFSGIIDIIVIMLFSFYLVSQIKSNNI